ncbi:hypothetical protein ACI2KT_01005 [Ensifer adhaerens]|uniref:hypothetical protein n=1 Tax=Ensifer adhaerens TaxID=106592 RepID=UPI003850C467
MNDPFSIRAGDRVESTESIVELALDDIKAGKVGAIATSRYVDWDHDWTKRYEAALEFHGYERFGGTIHERSAGFWNFVFSRKAGGS